MNEENKNHIESLKKFILEGCEYEFSNVGGYEEYYEAVGEEDERLSLFEIDDIDFSEIKGGLKSSLKKVNKKIDSKKNKRPITQGGFKRRLPRKTKKKYKTKVFVADDREIIIEGVDDFILNGSDIEKKIGWYNGEKLKQLVLIFNNTDGVDFELDLFRPSERVSYLIANSQDINDKITVSGGSISYQDAVINMMSNPAMFTDVVMSFSGNNVSAQISQPLKIISSNIAGYQVIDPIPTPIFFDTMQFQNNIVRFSLIDNIQRGYVPDGLDWIRYKVLAGNSVTICFYYKQHNLKEFFFKETRDNSVSRFLNKIN